MELEMLHIHRQEYGPRAGQYNGSIKFKGRYGNVEINLTDALSRQMLAVVAEDAVAASQQLGALLTSEIVDQTQGLPAPTPTESD